MSTLSLHIMPTEPQENNEMDHEDTGTYKLPFPIHSFLDFPAVASTARQDADTGTSKRSCVSKRAHKDKVRTSSLCLSDKVGAESPLKFPGDDSSSMSSSLSLPSILSRGKSMPAEKHVRWSLPPPPVDRWALLREDPSAMVWNSDRSDDGKPLGWQGKSNHHPSTKNASIPVRK